MKLSFRAHTARAILLSLCTLVTAPGQQPPSASGAFPFNEKLTYSVEWRLVNAGSATIQMMRDNATHGWNFNLKIESAGLVNRLYRVSDTYKTATGDHFCGTSADLDAQEGKRHNISTLRFDTSRHKVLFEERDLVRNNSEKKELDVPACTYEIVGALTALRASAPAPGKSVMLAITDGKKFANARIDAQAKENIAVNGKTYSTVRYEAYLFDNVLYKRKGRLLFWLTDDAEHVPVQFRLILGFPIGSVTVQLDKHERFG
jgi:hypothetical protein